MGERSYGEVVVTQRVDGSNISIPVILVRGKKPGQILCVNECIHGDEYAGMHPIIRIAHELNTNELCGTLVAIPVVNVPALEDLSRINHYDHLNMNRIFPGNPEGSLSQQIAHVFLNEVVKKCAAMVDLHGGGGYASIKNMVIAQKGFEKLAWDLALSTGFDLVWKGGSWGGTGRISALEAGIPAISVEAGGGMLSKEENVAVHMGVTKNVMRYLKMLPGQPDIAKHYRIMAGDETHAKNSGFFHPVTKSGQDVKKGELVGIITDLHGRTIDNVKAPTDGVLTQLRYPCPVSPGETLFILGNILEVREN
ncbi:MAG: succinylglutamate desuccinylase/aspartoacylase family protein [Anaerolineales bacterium]|nr:succinylglutamate desuccinylase/aspartoacylase family protein [Anaerolineales bacterium]